MPNATGLSTPLRSSLRPVSGGRKSGADTLVRFKFFAIARSKKSLTNFMATSVSLMLRADLYSLGLIICCSSLSPIYLSVSYKSQLLTVRGNGITSLIFCIPVRYITHLSNPSPNPACLVEPYLRRSR